MEPARVRRAILLFLLFLTLVVFARIASSAEGTQPRAAKTSWTRTAAGSTARGLTAAPSLRLEEPGGLVAGGSDLRRTVALAGLSSGSASVTIGWEARLDGSVAARGDEILAARGGAARALLSIPLPALEHPAGLDLEVEARGAGIAARVTFPFLVYPKGTVEPMASLFGRARVALYDPEGSAAPALLALGLRPERSGDFEALAAFQGDLIVIGPGGFARGGEALGPILAERVRAGMRVLMMEQATLPPTLSRELRLWPSFKRNSETTALLSRHPVLRGLQAGDARLVSPGEDPFRPLLPPVRGNFRVVSELRVPTGPAWQEGVTILELPMGAGTILAAQFPLCREFDGDPGARVVMANALAYLLGEGGGLRRTFLYGSALQDLPACVARLAPDAVRVPPDFEGVDVLLAAGDWRAPRVAAAAGLPAPAEVARYLREGGTLLLLNPQPLALGYLHDLVGSPVYFEPEGAAERGPLPDSPLFEGIAPEDRALLGDSARARFRLRALPGLGDVEPLLLAAGIAEYRVGRGTLVALSLPDASDCAAPRTSSLLARLFTNLGVPLEHQTGLPIPRLDD